LHVKSCIRNSLHWLLLPRVIRLEESKENKQGDFARTWVMLLNAIAVRVAQCGI